MFFFLFHRTEILNFFSLSSSENFACCLLCCFYLNSHALLSSHIHLTDNNGRPTWHKKKGIKKLSLCKNFRRNFRSFSSSFFYASYQLQYTVERIERKFFDMATASWYLFHGPKLRNRKNFHSMNKILWGEISVTISRDAVDNRVRTRVSKKIKKSLNSQIWIFHSVSLLHFIVGVYLACICMREIPSHYIIPLSACIFYPHKKSLNWFHHKQVNVTRGKIVSRYLMFNFSFFFGRK